jgi:hypothetical protein
MRHFEEERSVDEDEIDEETNEPAWKAHADGLNLSTSSYDRYVEDLAELNEEKLAEWESERSSILREMFPDGVDEDNLFNREE